jgi:hypothetical protein
LGDLHIELSDATGDKPGIVVAEIPAKLGVLLGFLAAAIFCR